MFQMRLQKLQLNRIVWIVKYFIFGILLGIFIDLFVFKKDRFRFDDLFSHILKMKYAVEPTEYIHWRTSLMDFTLSTADNALYPLLHFVLDDLPTSTRSPELDDRNTREIAVEKSGNRVKCANVEELMPLYLGYLIHVGFLDAPPSHNVFVMKEWENLKGKLVSRSLN